MGTSSVVTAIAHVGLTVPDLAASLELWCGELGFGIERTFTLDERTTSGTTGVRSASIRAALLVLGGQRLELMEYRPGTASATSVDPSESGATHIGLSVLAFDHVLEVFVRHGWKPARKLHSMTAGPRRGFRVVYLNGPAGGIVELLEQDPSRG